LGFSCLTEIFLRLLLTCNLNPNTLLKGIEAHLQVIWIEDYEEKFEGQIIFQPTEGVCWIPECDLIIIEEITFEEINKY